LRELNQVMSSTKNFSEYRALLRIANPPCVPFLGVFLTDLTFIEDGNTDMMRKHPHLINFSKRMKTAEVISDIQQYQSVPYHLHSVPGIVTFVENQLSSSGDIGELYSLSLKLEPREREDEKVSSYVE
jgi:son of sevenless-like protein